MSTESLTGASRNRLKVTIVGAGVGGLALAIRLTHMGFPVTVLETRSGRSATTEGAFLTLAPNGMNGLRTIGCYDAVRDAGINTTGIEILNARGKLLGFAGQADHEVVFGAPSVTVGRGALTRILLERTRELGIDVRFGAKVTGLDARTDGADVRLEDGTVVEGDVVVAADGLRSTVRALAFPEYPAPHYTGLIGTGGIVDVPCPPTEGVMRMTFGDNAFFGYIKEGDGPVYWFNSYSAGENDTGRIANPTAYARKIEGLHAADPSENRAILRSVIAIERNYPVYDMPELPAWSRDRVVLMGDAAHAVGPHAGQGASMAIEDAVVRRPAWRSPRRPRRRLRSSSRCGATGWRRW